MMNFCPNCGHRLDGVGRFCPACGSELIPPGAAAAAAAVPGLVAPEAAAATPPPAGGMVTRMRAIPDALALVFLVVAMVLPWDGWGASAGNVLVLLALLLALAACAAPYLLTPVVTGRTVPAEQVRLSRPLLLAPLGVVVLITLIRAAAQERGIGLGVAFAVTGAVLLLHALSRQDPGTAAAKPGSPSSPIGRSTGPVEPTLPWLVLAATLFLTAGGLGLIGLAKSMRDVIGLGEALGWGLGLQLLAVCAVPLWIGVGLLRRSASAWAGSVLLVLLLLIALAISDGSFGTSRSVLASGAVTEALAGAVIALMMAGAAAACAPGVVGVLRPAMVGPTPWVQAVRGLLTITAILLGGFVLMYLVVMTGGGARGTMTSATGIALLLFALVVLIGLVVLGSVLSGDPARGRFLTVWFMTALALVAIVVYAVTETRMDTLALMAYLLVPLTAIGLFTVPTSVRAAYGSLAPAAQAARQGQQPKPTPQTQRMPSAQETPQTQQMPPAQQAPNHGEAVRNAPLDETLDETVTAEQRQVKP